MGGALREGNANIRTGAHMPHEYPHTFTRFAPLHGHWRLQAHVPTPTGIIVYTCGWIFGLVFGHHSKKQSLCRQTDLSLNPSLAPIS